MNFIMGFFLFLKVVFIFGCDLLKMDKSNLDVLFKEFDKFCNQLDEKTLNGFVVSMRDFIENEYASLTIVKKNGRITGFDLKITYR